MRLEPVQLCKEPETRIWICTAELHTEPLGPQLASKRWGFAQACLKSQSRSVRGEEHLPNAFSIFCWGGGAVDFPAVVMFAARSACCPATVTTQQQVVMKLMPLLVSSS